MKNWTLSALLVATAANAHSIFQRVSVNGADKGFLVGVRAPDSDYPIYDVSSGNLACNTGWHSPVSTAVIDIPAGAKVGALWGHVLGGAQTTNDPDNPIAASHKGPISVYLASVSNAGTAGTSGLQWFKISQDGLSNGKWGVDNMISNGGWAYFTLPSCVPSGNYLMRVELIALHSASSSMGAQFYVGNSTFRDLWLIICNLDVLCEHQCHWWKRNLVWQQGQHPRAYAQNDPGILLSIYGNTGTPDNGGRAYKVPGPAPISCSGGGNSGGSGSGSSGTTTTAASGGGGSSGGAALYGQCGGQGWTGATSCSSGTCKVSNQWYSQCLP